ncbi:MAG: hypothetical protein AAFX80_00245 [Cyanobacteria bacterium J06639_18]
MNYFNQEQIPINNWLLEEVKEDFDAIGPRINVGSIKMQINILVASISGRFIPRMEGGTEEKIKQTILSSLMMVNQILPLNKYLQEVTEELSQEKFIQVLGFEDKAYIGFCDLLIKTVEERCKTGDFDFPYQIKKAKEVQQWMAEAGFTFAKINLIEGWKHPLAEIYPPSSETNNLATCNSWMFASMLCGAATERIIGGNVESAISVLCQMGIIENSSDSQLSAASQDDGIYLSLLNRTKEALDSKVEESIKNQNGK